MKHHQGQQGKVKAKQSSSCSSLSRLQTVKSAVRETVKLLEASVNRHHCKQPVKLLQVLLQDAASCIWLVMKPAA